MGPPRPPAWRRAGWLHAVACLLGLAGGLWPAAIVSDLGWELLAGPGRPPPALQGVAVGQVGFLFLVYPLALLWRQERRGEAPRLRTLGPEAGLILLSAAPFYVGATYLADATSADVLRLVLALAALWAPAVVAGVYLARGPGRSAALLVLLAAALGLPAAAYAAYDWLGGEAWRVLWDAGPATFAWSAAASRGATWWPRPMWAWLLWPGLALAAGLARWLLPRGAALRGPAGGAPHRIAADSEHARAEERT